MKNLKSHLIPAVITAVTTFLLLVITNPFGEILNSFLQIIAIKQEKLVLLRVTVSLVVVILAFLVYIAYLHKKYQYKKRFRFGVYWKEHTPFCPHCGGRLIENDDSYLVCILCEERLRMPFGAQTHIRLKVAIEELKKDGQ
ncbi:MAG: hypothetical protein Q8S39_09615 [Ignavibacteria bacterium]|nr:hypothetical protein [Ignavibacteria bacterium]